MTTTERPPTKKSTASLVLEAIIDLYACERTVTRELLVQVTGLPLTTVDDRVDYLIKAEDVVRIRPGIFEPARKFPETRPVSQTLLGDGFVKLEVGDDMLHLTPREHRMLSLLLGGAHAQQAHIDAEKTCVILNAELAERLRKAERKLAALAAQVNPAQMALLAAD